MKCCQEGCSWAFRETVLATLGAIEKVCPRCKTRQLIVFSRGAHVATVEFGGRNTGRLDDALREAGLRDAEVHLLEEIAREMAQ